jgi:hypothetical protein
MLADVSKDHSALILRAKQFIIAGMLVSEGDKSKVPRKVGELLSWRQTYGVE